MRDLHAQGVCAWARCAIVLCVKGHLVTPAMPWSLWSAVSVAVVVSRGDWRLAAQHFQPRQPTSEKEIWVAQMEGLLPSYLQSPLPVQRHPRYSIWEPVCVWCLWCGVVCECWGFRGGWRGNCACVCECKRFYEEMQGFIFMSVGMCGVSWH